MAHKFRPLARHRALASFAIFLLLAAFVLLLLVAISLPIIKPIYILALQATTHVQGTVVATQLRFGVWGVCAANAVGNQPATLADCIGPQLGYQVPPSLTSFIGLDQTTTTILTKALLVLLILHPIAAGLALLSLLFTFFLASHFVSILALLFAILSGIASTIVFAADIAIVVIARNKVRTLTDSQFDVLFGNGVWMVLAALALTKYVSQLFFACSIAHAHFT
ncbi:hypothetical protein AX17_004576 [Amanita inopinata Kibby_2008]|nr:hypothetical protein AX17_004576 [Amanita inopinata Kibby_2008]